MSEMGLAYQLAARGKRVCIYQQAKLIGAEFMQFGNDIIVDDFVLMMATKAGIVLKDFVHIGAFSSVMGGGMLVMEDFSGISAGVRLWTGNDDYLGSALTNPTVPEEFRAVSRSFIHMKKHTIVGSNSVVLPGVVIGEGAVVGANSLVKDSLEPWGVYAGNPCRLIKLRDSRPVLEREQRLRESQVFA